MNLTSKRCGHALLCLVLAVTMALAGTAQSKVANLKLVPVTAAYVFSVPDAPALWNAWKTNAIYGAFKKCLDDPDIQKEMESFNKGIKAFEEGIGYAINGESFAKIFKSFDVYVLAPEKDGPPRIGFAFEMADKEKAAKLITEIEKRADKFMKEQQAKEEKSDDEEKDKSEDKKSDENKSDVETKSDSPGADETDAVAKKDDAIKSDKPAESLVKTSDYNGVKIKEVTSDEEEGHFCYAMTDQYLLASTSKDELKLLVDRAQGKAAGETIQALAENSDKGLGADPAQMFVYVNNEKAIEMQKLPAEMASIKSIFRALAPFSFSASAINIKADSIESRSYGPFAAGKEAETWKKLLEKNPASKPLEIVGYAPAKTLIVCATNVVDMKLIHDGVKSAIEAIGGAETKEKTANQIKETEQMLGFSIENDLVPAFGNEMALMLNSVKFGGVIPEADAGLIFSIGDKDKMNKVLDSVEKLVQKQLKGDSESKDGAGKSGGAEDTEAKDEKKSSDKKDEAAVAPSLKTMKAGEATIKYVDIPAMPMITPGIAIDGKYLVIGTSKDAIKNMIEIKSGKGDSLAASENLKKLGPGVTTTANVFQYMNIAETLDTASAILAMIPPVADYAKHIDKFKVLKMTGASTTMKDGAMHSQSVLMLK
ncbi:MAG: DUF3352 domain-containing protein [bacterium]